jgi:hypothetical protein
MDSDIRAILADVRTERTRVNELDRKLTSAYLKARLSEASGLLDHVEGWLGTPSKRRMTVDSARWRDFVDGVLDMAERRRQHVQELVKRFGPDVETP